MIELGRRWLALMSAGEPECDDERCQVDDEDLAACLLDETAARRRRC